MKKSFLLFLVLLGLSAAAEAKPLKVFILAGQSNMEGHVKAETSDYIGDGPSTVPLLKKMCDDKGLPQDYEAKLISPSEEALWKQGALNAGYHYLGCAKTFALMGKAFAEALLPEEAP